jgi:outer membrane protein assembly factor BamB
MKIVYLLVFSLFLTSIHVNGQAENNLIWKYKTEGRIYATPAIDGENIYVGSADHYFYAIDKISGKPKWKFQTKGAVHSSPLIINNTVAFGSADGQLYVLNKKDGTLLWKFSSRGEKKYGFWDYYLSSPKEDNNLIYWGSGDGNLYVLDALTGVEQWRFKTNDIIHADPVIYEDKVFIGSFDGNLYALHKTSGELAWKFKTLGAQYFPKGEIQKAVLIDEETVYFGSRDYNIYALDVHTGAVKWNMREPAGWIIATPAVKDDLIYFGTSDAHQFYAVNKISGAMVWSIPVHMRVYGAAIVHENLVYFGTFDGKIMGVDRKTGKEQWQFQTEGSKKNYHTVFAADGKYIEGFQMYGQDMEKTEEMILDLGAVLCDPVIENNIMYFGSADGYLYSVDLNSK